MRKYYVLFVLAGAVFAFISCGQKSPGGADLRGSRESRNTASVSGQDSAIIMADEGLNDAACFVAGLPVKNKNSKLYALTQTKEWKNHARNMDQIWNSFQQTAPKAMAFAQTELEDINANCHTLFYPFGGPDFLFANTFFPDMQTYFLIGLEDEGSPIEVKHPSTETYRQYQNAVSDILNLSFFRSKDMQEEVSANDTITGVIPIISLLMARTDRKLVSIRNARLTDDGKVTTVDQDGTLIAENTGLVEFRYFRAGTRKLQTLYYFCTDIGNDRLLENKRLKAYINRLEVPTTATFIKCASYLMHEKSFSLIREMALNCSSAIIQDDSAIPLSYYDPAKWNINLYGTFYKPISLFARYPQPELRDAYQLGDPKPLNFRIGFSRQSNLQVMRKK